MIYTTTLNPSIDYIVKVLNFKEGETNRSHYEMKIPGGKGIMVSKLLNNLGINSHNIGFVGGFTGDFIEKSLKEIGIGTDFTKIKDDSRINVKLKTKIETEINAKGPKIRPEEENDFFGKIKNIKEDDLVVLSGSIPNSLSNDFYERIVVELNKKNIQFIIDTTGKKLLRVLKYKPFLIKPNKKELEDLFDVEVNSLEEIIIYGKKLLDLGAKNVIVSLGAQGAVFVNKFMSIYAPAIKGKLVNSVGAGDSMVGGFIFGIENELSVEESFKWAVASGTATAFSEDIGSRKFIEEMYSKVTLIKK
ncbi:MAG: 1-phosphofructokinase [Miniphocaeibacter sp.]|uniref:1-phosphofructokinase n=1 Tax=Miniphocaeibacter halophilus TaxID=2931922 RepID=A0AC61MRE7_9FIRM|nr:1-phosphofructokinase [Miniphocaeibacter halophilus]QQK08167.1 1-phosphofructokinase [Miniphocaeibacter halophilus]